MTPLIQQWVRFRTSPPGSLRPLSRLAPPFSFHWRTRYHQPQGRRKIQGI